MLFYSFRYSSYHHESVKPCISIKLYEGKNESKSNFKQSLYYKMVYIMEINKNSI